MEDVRAFLQGIGFDQYFTLFAENDLDMTLLPQLTLEDMKEIGITSLGHRKKIIACIREQIAHPVIDSPSNRDGIQGELVTASAEMRDVTTIFVDLTGYSQLSCEIGAEELNNILSRFYDRLDDVVLRAGGSIDRHIGDCVMAVFGAPVSHGNDAERALRATVEMHRVMVELSRRFKRQLSVHIGAAVGNVLFSAQGYGQRKDKDFSLTGDTVNLASRLSDQAKPGETLIDDRLRLALSHKIQCGESAMLEVQGYGTPVLAHRFVGFRQRTDAARLVGRDREMAALREAISACVERGSGAMFHLEGEAGIGKSHLAHAALREAEEAGVRGHTTLFLDFGLGEVRSPLNQLFTSMCGLAERAEPAAISGVIDRLVQDGVLADTSALFAVPMLGGKLDRAMTLRLAAMSDSAMIEGRNTVMRRMLRHFSARRPQLLLVEDVHWADEKALPVLGVLAEETQSNPILLLVTSRPEGTARKLTLTVGDGRAHARRMTLAPLTATEATELAWTSMNVSETMLDECVQKSQGNPLFLVQMLSHAKDSDGLVPSSIQSLVQARFDRLSPTDKRILHAAAVLGQRFTMDAVTRIAGIAAHDESRLIEAALIKPLEDGYLFSHALIRDGILRTLLRKDRRALHSAAAEWYAGRDSVLHAQHLAEAQDPGASQAWLTAASEARDAFRKEDALEFAESGLACAPDLRTKGALLCVKGDVLREMGRSEDSIVCFTAAEACAREPAEFCRAQIGIVAAMRILDRIDDAHGVLDRAQSVAEQAELMPELSTIHYQRGSLHFPQGNLAGCRDEHAKSLDYAQRAALPRNQALALSGLGDAAYARGQMLTAHKVIEQCLFLCGEHGLADVESANRFMLATVKVYMNETDQALDHALRSADLAEQLGTHRPEIVSRLTAGWILTSMARYAEAREQTERGLHLASRLGAKRFNPFLEETLARLALHEGDRERAAAIAEGALGKLREVKAETFIGPWVLSTVALTATDPARRAAALAEGEALLARGCVGHNYFRFYRNAMQACLDAGDHGEASRYADALERYTAQEPTPWSDFHIARTRAMVAVARGDTDATALDVIAQRAAQSGLLNAMPRCHAA